MLLAVIALAGSLVAREPQLPPGTSCDQVRHWVAEYGRAVAIAWAIRQGYSLREIAEAKKCLH